MLMWCFRNKLDQNELSMSRFHAFILNPTNTSSVSNKTKTKIKISNFTKKTKVFKGFYQWLEQNLKKILWFWAFVGSKLAAFRFIFDVFCILWTKWLISLESSYLQLLCCSLFILFDFPQSFQCQIILFSLSISVAFFSIEIKPNGNGEQTLYTTQIQSKFTPLRVFLFSLNPAAWEILRGGNSEFSVNRWWTYGC